MASTRSRCLGVLLLALHLFFLCSGHILRPRAGYEEDVTNEILLHLSQYHGTNDQQLQQLPEYIPAPTSQETAAATVDVQKDIISLLPNQEIIQPSDAGLDMSILTDTSDTTQDHAFIFNNINGQHIIFCMIASNAHWVLTMSYDYALRIYNPGTERKLSPQRLMAGRKLKDYVASSLLGIVFPKSTKDARPPARPRNLDEFVLQVVNAGGRLLELLVVEEMVEHTSPRHSDAPVHSTVITATVNSIMDLVKDKWNQQNVKYTPLSWRRDQDTSDSDFHRFAVAIFYADESPEAGEPGWRTVAFYGSTLGAFIEGPANECATSDPGPMAIDTDPGFKHQLQGLWARAEIFTPESIYVPLAKLVLWDHGSGQSLQGYKNNLGSSNGIVIQVLTNVGYWMLMIPGKSIVSFGLQSLYTLDYPAQSPEIMLFRSLYLGEEIEGYTQHPVDENLKWAMEQFTDRNAVLQDIIFLAPTDDRKAQGENRIRNVAFADAFLPAVKEMTKDLHIFPNDGQSDASFIRSPRVSKTTNNDLTIQSIAQDDLGGNLAGSAGYLVSIYYYEKLQSRVAMEAVGIGAEQYVNQMTRFPIGNALQG
ncbi:uncharacterized protein N7459_001932 [Penicillium hispanicum]|uniref:uncharacterized protein n=1 Tax=Penicillium hispanicum TaxID=1080232 RepID=UPI00254036E0|nr:uncharacterized protein N7459_001932 [Penicillium hispanicum]KAJ5591563.1 hypothetical protein N7459_001932 [Penicillium hispanicum]